MSRPKQKVHFGYTQSGQAGLFTGHTMACSLTGEEAATEETQRAVARRMDFEFESGDPFRRAVDALGKEYTKAVNDAQAAYYAVMKPIYDAKRDELAPHHAAHEAVLKALSDRHTEQYNQLKKEYNRA